MLPIDAPDRDRRPAGMPDDVAPDPYRELQVAIEGRPPSLNARRHWRQIAHDNGVWKATAANVGTEAVRRWERRHGLKWRKLERCDLTVKFIVPTRARHDFDNLISTIKPLLDGLVAIGVIADDSTDCIDAVAFTVEHEPKRTATIFDFAEIND